MTKKNRSSLNTKIAVFVVCAIILIALSHYYLEGNSFWDGISDYISGISDFYADPTPPTGTSPTPTPPPTGTNPPSIEFQTVVGSRIYEADSEVVWRGAGCSYLWHYEGDPVEPWRVHLNEMKSMGLNTARLAFKFDWDTLGTADVFDMAKMDAIVKFLGDNGIKSILDYHGGQPYMYDDFEGFPNDINPHWVSSWLEVAEHYKNNPNIVAYEIFNEPARGYSDWYAHTAMDNAVAYHYLTNEIRKIDPNHIIVWETQPNYIPPFEEIENLMLPNVVYTIHCWWSNNYEPLEMYGVEEVARSRLNDLMNWRDKYNIPLWLGEFGGTGGGTFYTMNWTDLRWDICKELFEVSEEQVMGWNVWLGKTSISSDRLVTYGSFMYPSVYSTTFVRQAWIPPALTLENYLVDSNGIDDMSYYWLKMYHNGDYATFREGITIRVAVQKIVLGISTWTYQEIQITTQTTITNTESATLGDHNTIITILGFNS